MAFKLPPAQANSAWAQRSGQFTATTSNLLLAGDLSDEQSTSIGDGDEFPQTTTPLPIVASGKIMAMDGTGHISAHDLASLSNKIWSSEALVDKDDKEVLGGGLAAQDDKLYAVSGLGQAAAININTGETLWTRNLGIPLRSAPRVQGGIMVVISIESQTFALDVATGKTLWTHRGISEMAGLLNTVSPAFAGGMVIVPYASGELYALKLDTGEEVWRTSLSQTRKTSANVIFSGVAGDPVVDDSVVFAISSGGAFSVFNLMNGMPLWEKPISSINTPWVSGDYVFVVSEENTLIAMLKYDGSIRWTKQLVSYHDEKRKLYPIVWRGPVLVSDKLALVSSAGEMILVDAATGDTLKTIDVPNDVSAPPIVADGKIYLVNKSAELVELK
jgi:outer membrane protein assembly factor BamB